MDFWMEVKLNEIKACVQTKDVKLKALLNGFFCSFPLPIYIQKHAKWTQLVYSSEFANRKR